MRVVVHLLIDKVRFYKYQSLEEYCKYYTGTFFYKMSGLSNYIKRFHADIPVNEVSKEFGEQRISGLQHNGIRKFMRRGLSYFAKKMAGSPSKVFSRPKEGYQMLFEKIENILTNKGITIQKDINIQKIERKDAQFQLYTEKEILFFDYVIFTTPLEVVASLFNRKLSYPPKHIHLLSLFYKGKVHSSSNVIYNFSNEGNWKRMIVFSKYYGQHEGKDYFTIEVPITTYNEAKISELQLDFEQFVQKTPFFEDIIFQGKAFTPYAYPLLDPKIEATRNQLISEIEAEYGILLIGRQGKHEYLNSSPIIANTIKDITVFWEKMQQIVY